MINTEGVLTNVSAIARTCSFDCKWDHEVKPLTVNPFLIDSSY
jgi:hypothetical protein